MLPDFRQTEAAMAAQQPQQVPLAGRERELRAACGLKFPQSQPDTVQRGSQPSGRILQPLRQIFA